MWTFGFKADGASRAGRGLPLHRRGLTLIELMTTLAVLVISLSLAAPAFTSFLRSNRLRAAQSELVSSLMLARSEAARQGARVGVEALRPVAEGGFAKGWRVWVDTNANGSFDEGEAVVREVLAPSSALTINSKTPPPSFDSDVLSVVFSPSGFLLSPSSAVCFVLSAPTDEARGFRVLLEQVGLSDVAEVATCL